MPEQYTLEEFGKRIKAKYPQYANLGDTDIANKVLAKYPQYKTAIKPSGSEFAPGPKNTEWLYQMQGPGGNFVGVPYSKVMTASGAGWKIKPQDRDRYATDRLAALKKKIEGPPQPWYQQLIPGQPRRPVLTEGDFRSQGPLPEAVPPQPGWWQRTEARVQSATEPTTFFPGMPASQYDPATGEMTLNTIKRAGRVLFGVADFGPQAWGALKDSLSDDPDKAVDGETRLLEMHPAAQIVNRLRELRSDWHRDPKLALSNVAGDVLGYWLAGKATEKGSQLVTHPAETVKGFNQRVALPAAKTMTGTGPRGIGKLVRETQTENVAGAEKAAEATREYNRSVGETAQGNRKAVAAEVVRGQAAADTQVKGSQLMTGVKALEKRVRATANGKYEAVKAKVGDDADPRGLLMADVQAAQDKWIRGSPEKIKEFQAILQPPKTSPAATLADQTAENLGYKNFAEAVQNPQMRETLSRVLPPDVFQEATTGVGGMLGWNDYQGFYEETGAKLAPGDLPSDIFNAVKEVHEKVGNRMEAMARRHNALPEWYDAKNYYRQFMETFHDATGPSGSASPIAQAFLAKDPATAAKFFLGSAGDRAVVDLSRYDPQLTQLAQDLRQSREAAKTAPKGVRKEVAPPPESTKFAPRTISPEDIRARHRADLQATADLMANLGRRRVDWSLLTAGGSLVAILGEFKGVGLLELAGGGAIAAPFISEGFASFLERPGVVGRLERITLADVNNVPPQLRSQALQDLRPLLIAARGKGAKINPAVWALAMGAPGAATRSIKELRKDAQQKFGKTSGATELPAQPAAATAPPGPQSSALPYTHFYDEASERILPV